MSTTAANQARAAALKAARAKDSELKRRRALAALEALKATGAPITFTAVAKAAGVSTWLVYAEGIREHIDAARRRQAHHSAAPAPTPPGKHTTTSASLRTDLAIARDQVKTLRAERDKLQQRLRLHLGVEIEGPDRAHLTARVADLEALNRRLVAERDARMIDAGTGQGARRRTRRRAKRRTRKPATGHQIPEPRTMTTAIPTPQLRPHTPRASRVGHPKMANNKRFRKIKYI